MVTGHADLSLSIFDRLIGRLLIYCYNYPIKIAVENTNSSEKNMLYAHFAEISEKNAHIRIKLTCLIRMFERACLVRTLLTHGGCGPNNSLKFRCLMICDTKLTLLYEARLTFRK